MKFVNPTKLFFDLPFALTLEGTRLPVVEFLKKEGYRAIRYDSSEVHAKRGTWLGLLIGGDPRRLPHSIRILKNVVSYEVMTQLVHFSHADQEVFRSEFQSLLAIVVGDTPPKNMMAQAQRTRCNSDLIHYLKLGIITAVLTYAALYFL